MGSRVIFAAVAAEVCIFVAAASGCASGASPKGFGSSGSASQVKASALGTYAASASVTQEYGITEWRTYVGKTQMVVTGYRADGTASRGMQFAWFAPAPGSAGHTRLMMLDGSGAVLRRLVGGGETGHLSSSQLALVQTMRSDVAMGRQPALVQHRSGPGQIAAPRSGFGVKAQQPTFTRLDGQQGAPNTGPQCFQASSDPSTVLDASGCILGAATFETVVGGIMALETCAQWEVDNVKTNMTCAAENAQSCNNDDPPTCNYGQDTNTPPPAAPQAQCDQACICANYGVYNGMPCTTTCVDNNGCSTGQECHWGSCTPAASVDSPTHQDVTQQTPGTTSCSSGDVTPDPSTGQVGCSGANGNDAGSAGGSSGSGSGGGSSGTDTSGGDPTSSSSGGASGGNGGQCASDGAGCSQDSDCCLGACGGGTCGMSAAGGSSGGGSGSSSGGSCAADGNACGQDSDCCNGSCDTSSGTCGSGSSGSSSGGSGSSSGGGCTADGNTCAQDSDCCSGSCDTSSGTCGSGSGSSSGGSSSGSSSGGGCASDGSSCSQDSDCCNGSCTSGTCGSGTSCSNPGDACSQDSDCCSGSCDTSAGTCN